MTLYVCVCVFVCLCVCVYNYLLGDYASCPMNVCKHRCISAELPIDMYVCVYVYVYMYVCMYVYRYIYVSIFLFFKNRCITAQFPLHFCCIDNK
jgi:hypothetical protein